MYFDCKLNNFDSSDLFHDTLMFSLDNSEFQWRHMQTIPQFILKMPFSFLQHTRANVLSASMFR